MADTEAASLNTEDGYIGTHYSYQNAANATDTPEYASDDEREQYEKFSKIEVTDASPFDPNVTRESTARKIDPSRPKEEPKVEEPKTEEPKETGSTSTPSSSTTPAQAPSSPQPPAPTK